MTTRDAKVTGKTFGKGERAGHQKLPDITYSCITHAATRGTILR